MLNKIYTSLTSITPWHGCTYWTHLWRNKNLKIKMYGKKIKKIMTFNMRCFLIKSNYFIFKL